MRHLLVFLLLVGVVNTNNYRERLVRAQAGFSKDLGKLVLHASDRYYVALAECYRPEVTQRYYLQKGLSKTLNSKHRKKLACDLVLYDRATLKPIWSKVELQHIGQYWESLHQDNTWGGSWKSFPDTGHFERNF